MFNLTSGTLDQSNYSANLNGAVDSNTGSLTFGFLR